VELVGAWKTDLGEMCRKTVIRRIYKYLPKTNVTNKVMFERLQNAVESIDKEHKSEATPIADVFDEFTDVTTEATPPPAMEKPPIATHNAVPIKEEAQPTVKETKTSSIKPPTSN
jgi:recombinational DNA repair protein RecT